MGSSFVSNLLFTGSMNSLWSLLNNVQVVVFVPMFAALKFPNNASALNRQLISVANFEVINTSEWVDLYLFYFGEGSPFSYNFE